MGTANTSYRVVEVAESGLDSRSIGQFIEEHWRKRIALSVPRFFDWQFTDSPANRGRNRCLLILDRDARIFGFMGVTVREFNLDGRRVVGAELTTWILNEEVRGLGLGKAIVGRLQESYEAIIGMGISDSALPIYATHGFKYMRHLSRYVRIHDAERVASISKLDALGERMVRKAPEPVGIGYTARSIEASEAAELAELLYPKFNCTVRSPEYLEWRYTDHPYYEYEIFRIGDGSDEAAVVLRIDDKQDLRIVHVIDYLGAATNVPAVISFIDDLCRDRGAAFADFYCSADPIGTCFWSHGWFSSVDDFYLQVPNWFYPIDMRIPPTTSLILWSRSDPGALLDRGRVYITKGDCDMDRPTVQYFDEKGIEY